MPDLDDLGLDIEASLAELGEAAGGRRSIFRRFVSGERKREEIGDRQNGAGGEQRQGTTST